MHDIRRIRQDEDGFRRALIRRNVAVETIDALVAADQERRAVEARTQTLLARRNEVARLIADAKRAGQPAEALLAEGRGLAERVPALETEQRAANERFADLAARVPNAALDTVPDGPDETGNVVVRTWGTPQRPPHAREHWEIGPALGMDADAGAQLAGTRFTVLRGPLARLERVLGQFMLDLHTAEHGYTEVAVPLMVRPEILQGTGQLPKFEEDLFRVDEQHWMVPTAEVPLTNLVRGRALDPATLPLRLTALTPCFRAEAGAAGRDTRGMIRQHQFMKTELVSVVLPEDAEAELERMRRCAETVLERLGLPYRTVLLCTGDMGFAAAKTYDLEAWLPGQNAYREISSCSTCGDFQARRMGARLKGRPDLPHTLNGSGVAVGRALVAVLENCSGPDGTVTVPEALHPYMGGLTVLRP